MNEEEKIFDEMLAACEKKFGHDNHFTVPEGYFEGLTAEIMGKLPEPTAKTVRLRPVRRNVWKYAVSLAACLLAAVFSINMFINKPTPTALNATANADTSESAYFSTIDQVADYTMLDNEAIYAYVSEN